MKEEKEDGRNGHNVINYSVDNEPQETEDKTLTVEQILTKATLDPATHYLIELRGDNQITHQNLTEVIKLHEKMKFISVLTGPTPLS